MFKRFGMSLAGFIVLPSIAFAWQSKADNKAVDELMLISDVLLTHEGIQACITSVSGRMSAAKHPNLTSFNLRSLRVKEQAIKYVNTIALVAQQKHGGTTPDWMVLIQQGVSSDDMQKCSEAQTTVNKQILSPKKK
jgi:hypothetical protein